MKVVTLDLFCKGYVHCYFAYISNTSKACWSIHQKQKKARYVSCNRSSKELPILYKCQKMLHSILLPTLNIGSWLDRLTYFSYRFRYYIGIILKYRFWLVYFRGFALCRYTKQSQKRKPIIQSISSVGFDK